MKHILIAITFVLGMTQIQAQAFEAIATVVESTPIVEQVNRPTQQCWTETQQVVQNVQQQHTPSGAIIGGIIGGLLGSTIGRGNGRVAAAAVGAGVGAMTGDHVANQNNTSTVITTVPVQHCRQVDNIETIITGYMVIYEFDGQRFSTRLPYQPGRQLKVNIAVTPR